MVGTRYLLTATEAHSNDVTARHAIENEVGIKILATVLQATNVGGNVLWLPEVVLAKVASFAGIQGANPSHHRAVDLCSGPFARGRSLETRLCALGTELLQGSRFALHGRTLGGCTFGGGTLRLGFSLCQQLLGHALRHLDPMF
jgi:hypothetical protein